MTSNLPADVQIQGSLRSADGAGIVRLVGRFAAGVDDLWLALTDRGRLAGWLGDLHGELRQGCELRGHWVASGWEGTVRVEACEPPRRLLVLTQSPDEPDGVIEVTLTPDGEQTVLEFEDRGLPLDQIAAYGAGDQIHIEDLAAYLAGGAPCDARTRWQELHPGYRDLAAGLTRIDGQTLP